MEITNDNRRAHQALSNCSLKFLEFVKEDPGRLTRSNYNGLETPDPKWVLQPWPTFVGPHMANELREASTSVFTIIKSLLRRFFSYDAEKISRYYEIPMDITQYFLYGVSDEHINNLLARGDFIISPSGLKCIEFNVSSNLGGAQLPVWETMLVKIPVIAEFLRRYHINIINKNLLSILMEHIISITRRSIPIDDELNVVIAFTESGQYIADPREHAYANQLFQEILQQRYNPLKGEAIFCDYSKLKMEDEHLYYQDKEVHFLLEFNNGTAPFRMRIAHEKGNTLIYNGLVTQLVSNKLNIALMSEHQDSDIFTPQERETIKKYIPWTRKVKDGETTYNNQKIKLEDFIISNREQLVLKPGEGLGGVDVYLGYTTPEYQWRQAVEKAFQKKNWLVQERVDSYPFLYQYGKKGYAEHNAVWGTFVFGNQYGGSWLRIQPRKHPIGIINIAQQAEITILFEVEE